MIPEICQLTGRRAPREACLVSSPTAHQIWRRIWPKESAPAPPMDRAPGIDRVCGAAPPSRPRTPRPEWRSRPAPGQSRLNRPEPSRTSRRPLPAAPSPTPCRPQPRCRLPTRSSCPLLCLPPVPDRRGHPPPPRVPLVRGEVATIPTRRYRSTSSESSLDRGDDSRAHESTRPPTASVAKKTPCPDWRHVIPLTETS
jgi:hypothetical protein